MTEIIIGPNPCHECGGEYGDHLNDCVNKRVLNEITAHVVAEDARYPILCINGKFNYGLSIDPQTGEIGRDRFCICHARMADECICNL